MSACDNEDTPQAIAANQPRELLKLISTNVRQLAFEEYRKGWDKAWLCYHVVCRPVDHLSERDYDAITATFLTECGETIAEACEEPEIVEEENFDDWLWERESETFSHSDKHRDNIDTLERKIGENPDLRDDPKFADARKVGVALRALDILPTNC